MKSALVILFENFEEIEAVSAVDVLRRGQMDVTVTSLAEGKNVTGSHQITCVADTIGIPEKIFDAIIIPGGPGIAKLRHNETVKRLVRQQYESGRLVAAICAAPVILHDLNILDKHHYTAHFGVQSELKEARIHELVVTDGNIITACGPAAGINFGLAILEYFETISDVRVVSHEMMCDLWT